MEKKKIWGKAALSLLLLLLLGYRILLVAQNAAAYREYWRWDWDFTGGSLEMLPGMLMALVLMLAAVCIVQLGPFLVIISSILANWARPPRNRTMYILCICACIAVFLGEGFFCLVGMLGGTRHVWEKPSINLVAAAINAAGLLLAAGRREQG